ncbi:ABC transporter permease [Pseudorhizobium pelagicum]|uniref:Spermidine/putrescine ABC transporter permease n=1 Tax=Pseudorhizobium pelagicum TaxID=1509405 RepID=A0A922T9D7_9HYPH|nr:iron ABC transporter permease [Pseudorhizobium pelagicum]KEQ03691.1 spermidine/putrescine ABC transporter permease [Pseudorhizobium pelagicum]KEQ08253.1 spermidine/putrescine ABC transporter permease [Pseudorhizobium pelagicum]
MKLAAPRTLAGALTLVAIFLPIGLIVYQSLLSGAFFEPRSELGFSAFRFILSDPGFWKALGNSMLMGISMLVIAVPLGSFFAFLLVRTDTPGRKYMEPFMLAPMLTSPVVLAFGYLIAAGPVGFYSIWTRQLIGTVPWNIYSPISIAIIGGLIHVPHVYIYTSTALKNLASDIEEAARISGASPLRVAWDVSLPMIRPALIFSSVLVFLAGVETFGLVLILGNRMDFDTLAVYLYKLTNRLGVPSYQLMAAVAVVMLGLTIPLVTVQRFLLRGENRFASLKGKGARQRPVQLGSFRWVAFAIVCLWAIVTVVVPLSGVTLRAFVTSWGQGVDLISSLTLENFRIVFSEPSMLRAIKNSILIGVIGGALSVACYVVIALVLHRKHDGLSRSVDFSLMLPRALPGVAAGLAFFWAFLFFWPLTEFRTTLFSVWLAYTVVWLPYGVKLVQTALIQVSSELEEAARSVGAKPWQVIFDVSLPLVRFGILSSWVLVFIAFEREYATGVYLLNTGTEVVGAMLVSLADGGSINMVAALSVINITLVCAGMAVALRFGIKLHD